jgi:hypothetical protein
LARGMKIKMACAALLVIGCASEPAQDQHSAALTTWQSLELDSYSFTWKRDCECTDSGRKIRIEVDDGQISSAVYLDNVTPVGDDLRAHLMTIDGIFVELANAVAGNAELIDVTYEPTIGFPTSVYVDYSSGIADEELALTISDVRRHTAASADGISCGGR